MEHVWGDFGDYDTFRSARQVDISQSGNRVVVRQSLGFWQDGGFVVFDFNAPTASWKQVGNDVTVGKIESISISRDGARITTFSDSYSSGFTIGIYELNGSGWELVDQEASMDFRLSLYDVRDYVLLLRQFFDNGFHTQAYFYSEGELFVENYRMNCFEHVC